MQPATEEFQSDKHETALHDNTSAVHDVSTAPLLETVSLNDSPPPSSQPTDGNPIDPGLENVFKQPAIPYPQIIKLEPHEPNINLLSRKRSKMPPPGGLSVHYPSRSNSGSSRGSGSSTRREEFPGYTLDDTRPSTDSPPSPYPSNASDSPQFDAARLSPASANELSETRQRSRRNEAKSRDRNQRAESNLRTAIYRRGRQIPSSKHRVCQMAADILTEDDVEITTLNASVAALTNTNLALNGEVQQLRTNNSALSQDNERLRLQVQNYQLNIPSQPQQPYIIAQPHQVATYPPVTPPGSGYSPQWPNHHYSHPGQQ